MERVRVSTDTGYRTISTNDRHTWYADSSVAGGGEDSAPNPEEILLSALGSCTVITLHMYANRKGWDLQKVDIEVTFEKVRAEDAPEYTGDQKYVNRIRQNLRFIGDLDDTQRERLYEIAGKCPVHRIIDGPTITTERMMDIDETVEAPKVVNA